MYAYKDDWNTVQHIWFYINQKGKIEQLTVYPYIKPTIGMVIKDDKERKEITAMILNNSKVKKEIGNRDFEVVELWKYINIFTNKETAKIVYIKINNTNLTYAITICNGSISIENITCEE